MKGKSHNLRNYIDFNAENIIEEIVKKVRLITISLSNIQKYKIIVTFQEMS